MNEKYKVYFLNQPVGVVEINKEGLYCYYKCICSLPKSKIFRISLILSDQKINLGVCVPKGNHYETAGKIPLKQIKGTEYRFIVESNDSKNEYILINSETPFPYLEEIDSYKFWSDEAQIGVILK